MKWGQLAHASEAEVAAYHKTQRDAQRDGASLAANGGGWKNGGRRRKTASIEHPDPVNHMRGPPEPGEEGSHHLFGANPGDLWTIPNQPFAEAHFATYPEELVRRVLQATCPREVCTHCGAPRRSVMGTELIDVQGATRGTADQSPEAVRSRLGTGQGKGMVGTGRAIRHLKGYSDCGCQAPFTPGIVLDPFAGSGTTGLVAAKMGRGFILIELNPTYVQMIRRRVANYLAPLTSFPEAPVDA